MSTLTVSTQMKNRMMTPRAAINAMFVFVPIAVLGEQLGLGPVALFVAAALSCVPLSYWLGQATEALGDRLGPVSVGLLNATFCNAAELIISVMAISHGLFVVVRTSLVGSVLGQLLLVLGTSLLLAGIKHGKLRFSQSLTQVNFTLMAIALVALGLPSILLATTSDEGRGSVSFLSPTLAVLLIIIYSSSVLFTLRGQPSEDDASADGPEWSPAMGLVVLAAATGGMIVISETLVGSIEGFIEETGMSEVFLGLILIPIFSNVVDHIVAITVALKNRMDLSLTVSVGSAAQVACLVIPTIVLISTFTGQSGEIIFASVELVAMAVGLLMIVPVLLDGRSNWLEGAQLLTVYTILGTVLWVI